jgi:hypothetical protein
MNRVINDLEELLESAELDGEDEYADALRKAIEILKNHK